MKTRKLDTTPRTVPPQWDKYYRKLKSLRKSLLEERANGVFEQSEAPPWHGARSTGNGSNDFNHSLALGILDTEEDALFEVDAAIQRIFDGTYGICEKSGAPIPSDRLCIVPWTRFTKETLEALERQKRLERSRTLALMAQ